jgi:FkbM family methyltransferase
MTYYRRVLVNILCCFVPCKSYRKKIRHRFISRKEWLEDLLSNGFTMDNEIITTPAGVRIDVSNKADDPLFLVKEIFLSSEYNLNLGRESILIDIGMNRAAASLLFASNQNIKKIYAYEPLKPTFEQAKRNLDLNPHLASKINAFNYGLGQADGTLELSYMTNATSGMSTTHDIFKGAKNVKKEIVSVKDAAKVITPIMTENKGKYIVVKCDCEGAEFEIFERLNEQGIIKNIDVVIMEYHFEKPDRLVNILTENGFAVQVKDSLRKSKILGYIYAVRMTEKRMGN